LASALLAIISRRKGKYYVSFVAVDNDRDRNPKIAILGPFTQAEKAQQEGEKWTKLGNEAIENNEPVSLPDLKTVPTDVRTYITEAIRKAIREQGVQALMKNPTFGQILLSGRWGAGT
jgi:hypothetical protein